jgi:DNA-directed RNA polymerase specialized sigma24 family protein
MPYAISGKGVSLMSNNFKIHDFPRNLEFDVMEKLAEKGLKVSKFPPAVDKVLNSILLGAGKTKEASVLDLRYKEAKTIQEIAKAMDLKESEVEAMLDSSLALVQNDVFQDAFGFEFQDKDAPEVKDRKQPSYYPWNMVYDMVGYNVYWSDFKHTNDEFRSSVDFVIATYLDRDERLALMYRYNTRKVMSDKDIAGKLGISEAEVPSVFESAFDKLRQPPCYEMIKLGITRYYQIQIALAVEEDRKKR